MQGKMTSWAKKEEKTGLDSENVDKKTLSIEEVNAFWEGQERIKQKAREGSKNA